MRGISSKLWIDEQESMNLWKYVRSDSDSLSLSLSPVPIGYSLNWTLPQTLSGTVFRANTDGSKRSWSSRTMSRLLLLKVGVLSLSSGMI